MKSLVFCLNSKKLLSCDDDMWKRRNFITKIDPFHLLYFTWSILDTTYEHFVDGWECGRLVFESLNYQFLGDQWSIHAQKRREWIFWISFPIDLGFCNRSDEIIGGWKIIIEWKEYNDEPTKEYNEECVSVRMVFHGLLDQKWKKL